MASSLNLAKKLDKSAEDLSPAEILNLPPSALAGVTEKHDEAFAALGIKTIKDLGTNKHFVFARALVEITGHEG